MLNALHYIWQFHHLSLLEKIVVDTYVRAKKTHVKDENAPAAVNYRSKEPAAVNYQSSEVYELTKKGKKKKKNSALKCRSA